MTVMSQLGRWGVAAVRQEALLVVLGACVAGSAWFGAWWCGSVQTRQLRQTVASGVGEAAGRGMTRHGRKHADVGAQGLGSSRRQCCSVKIQVGAAPGR